MTILTPMLFVAFAMAGEEPLVLAEAGRPGASVVVPDDASQTVTAAAEELVEYLEKMSGAELPLVAESKAGTGLRIDVGPTRRTLGLLPHETLVEEERVIVRSVPGSSRRELTQTRRRDG